MTHDKTKTLRIGEPYFAMHDLTEAELDAIETLSGTRPMQYGGDEEEEGENAAPEEDLLATFLDNAVQYAARHGFEPETPEGFADLASYAE